MFESIQKLVLESKEGKIKLNQKASIFFFCLLLSTFFWFLSALSKNYTTTLNFPISYVGYSDDFILMEAPLEQIQGRVFGSGYELLGEQVSLNRSPIEIDLKKARATSNPDQYYILTKNLREKVREELDRDIQLQALLPDSLFFFTQARAAKMVPVRVAMDLNYEKGHYQRGEILVNPKQIKISGPKSYIDTLQMLWTENTKHKELKDSLKLKAKIQLPEDIEGVQLESPEVEVLVPVEKFTEKQLDLEVEIRKTSEKVQLIAFPNKVSARFLVPLSLYEVFNANQVQAYIKYSIGDEEESDKLEVQLQGIPDYANLIRIEPERVEYIVKK